MRWWEWSPSSISIVNMDEWGTIPTFVWVMSLAICGDEQMAGQLGNPLESQHQGVLCAAIVAPATFK